jgi:hypothetical protein
MSYTAKQCLDKARDCALMASQATDRQTIAAFAEISRQWQEIARQKEDMERGRPELP